MQGLTNAKITCRRLTWLLIGFCFVVLYSCPVKKYLLMTFAGASATETSTSSYQKDLTSYSVKIVYLSRRSTGYTIFAPSRAVRPVLPMPFQDFTLAVRGDDAGCVAAMKHARQGAFDSAPPRWLEDLRLRI